MRRSYSLIGLARRPDVAAGCLQHGAQERPGAGTGSLAAGTNCKADTELAGYAPLALGEAERALRQAEAATGDTQRIHLIYMADRRIQVARAVAQREQLEQELDRLGDGTQRSAGQGQPAGSRACPAWRRSGRG